MSHAKNKNKREREVQTGNVKDGVLQNVTSTETVIDSFFFVSGVAYRSRPLRIRETHRIKAPEITEHRGPIQSKAIELSKKTATCVLCCRRSFTSGAS